jgi:hypothetical protein
MFVEEGEYSYGRVDGMVVAARVRFGFCAIAVVVGLVDCDDVRIYRFRR